MHDENLGGNAETIEAWNTVLFDKFSRYRAILTTGLAIHGDAAMEREAPGPGARVLDIGCGFGDTTLALARRVGPKGAATGVDAAARFIEVARAEAKAAAVSNARFLVADAQTEDLGGPYDLAFSRMGTMFFASPVVALRNIRKSLASGGRLSMAVWRRKDENPFLTLVEQRVLEIMPVPQKTDKTEQVTSTPGPFSMSSPDVLSAQLLAAGFARPTFERFDAEIFLGKDLPSAIEFALLLGPAGEIMRLAGEEGEKRRPEVVAALEELLAPFTRADGVHGMSSSWIVTAHAP
jgi:ubiquinone/menaquinone biosynthesis C-methylase UbiE